MKENCKPAAAEGPITLQAESCCANCGAHAPGRFCPECGQETALGPSAVREVVGRGRALVLTLWSLLTQPGGLTLDYLRGRRARYLRPLQLYLLVSVLVFSGVQLLDLDLVMRLVGERGLHVLRSKPSVGSQPTSPLGAWTPVGVITAHVDTPAVRRFVALPEPDRFALLHARRTRYVSSMLLLLVPALAITLAASFRGRHKPFLAHLVFAAHVQAFLLLGILVEAFLPTAAANALSWWMLAYVFLALRRVHGRGWGELLVRGGMALAGYFVAFYVANLLLVFSMISI